MAFGSSIIARLGLDSREFREGVATAQAALGGFAAGVAGGLISGAAIKSVVDYGEHIEKLSERYRINTTELQRLGGVAEKEGSSLEGTAAALKKLEVASDRAKRGNSDLVTAFQNLNVTVDDLRTLSPSEIFKKIGSSSLNAADLVKVLGKNALELRPTMEKLANGTAQFSAAIDEIDVRKLAEASDKLKELEASARKLGAHALVGVGDGFHVVANDARNLSEDTKNVWTNAMNIVASVAKGKFGEAAVAIGQLKESELQALRDLYSYRENGPPNGGVEGRANLTHEPAKTPAQEKAEQKERERLQFGLDTLAEQTPDDTERRNNIQSTFAGQQAREVQRLEAQARREALLYGAQDPNAGRATLDRADALRQQIGGLKESEKQVGVYKAAFSDALAPAIQILDEIAANTE
jgi:hypothetical protein